MLVAVNGAAGAQPNMIKTSIGDLRISPIYHAGLMIQFAGKGIYVDPVNLGDSPTTPRKYGGSRTNTLFCLPPWIWPQKQLNSVFF